MMWMEIPKYNKKRKGENPISTPYLPFLTSIQHEAQEKPNSVVLIECKNEFDAGRPASAYEIAYILGIPTALTVSIEGDGISPFLNALFIAHLHLRDDAASVIVVASPVSSISSESSGCDVKKDAMIDRLWALRLLSKQPAGGLDSLQAYALPVSFTDANNLTFQSVPVTANSAWLLNPRGVNAFPTVMEQLSYQPSESNKWEATCCHSCFDLLKKISAILGTDAMMEKGLLLV